MWLQRGSHATPSLAQGPRRTNATMTIAGRKQRPLYALFDPSTSYWRTSQACFEGMQAESPLTWPRWATWDQAGCYLLPTKALTTSAKGSGFVATPTRTANQLSPSMQKHPGCRAMRPTPNAGSDRWGFTWQELGGQGNALRNSEMGSQKIHPNEWEWMMGWPTDWTALEPLAAGKFQQWLSAHGRS